MSMIPIKRFMGLIGKQGLCQNMEINWKKKVLWNEINWISIGINVYSNFKKKNQLYYVYGNVGHDCWTLKK